MGTGVLDMDECRGICHSFKISGLGTKKGAKSRNGFMKSFQALHKRRKGFLSMIL